MDKDFIKVMFESKMEKNLFNFSDPELIMAKREKAECNEKLFDELNTLLASEEQDIIKNLIQDYRDIRSKCYYIENALYYKAGFKDAFSMKKSLEN